jgi:predicted ATPase
MITHISLRDYKCLHKAEMPLGKINLITGKNSSGKSSVIQGLKLFSDNISNVSVDGSKKVIVGSQYDIMPFNEICNFYTDADSFAIQVNLDDLYSIRQTFTPSDGSGVNTLVTVEKDSHLKTPLFPTIFHLPASRISNRDHYSMNSNTTIPLGKQGEFVIDYFYKNRQNLLDEKFVAEETNDASLETQVNYWLYGLTGYKMEIERKSEQFDVYFKDNIGKRIHPSQVGTGVGYISALLIVCLGVPIGSFIAIENPEIHLHPKAQSDLTVFLAKMANAGNQLLVETHSDHIVNGLLLRVKESKDINNSDLKAYYFDEDDEFDDCMSPIPLDISSKGNISNAPSGFFDQYQLDLRKLIGM